MWILAALADVCGLGRRLIPEIAEALKAQRLLEKDMQVTSVDQMLDGLERTSSQLAATMNTNTASTISAISPGSIFSLLTRRRAQSRP